MPVTRCVGSFSARFIASSLRCACGGVICEDRGVWSIAVRAGQPAPGWRGRCQTIRGAEESASFCRYNELRLFSPGGKGVTMNERDAEYWRGYGEGVYFRIRQRMGDSGRDHLDLPNAAQRNNGDPCVDAYARGYRDGCQDETHFLVLPERDQSDDERLNGAV
jgi:hypothetical protein